MSRILPIRPAAGVVRAAGLLATATIVGCASATRSTRPPAGAPPARTASAVMVTNEDVTEVRVYVVTENGVRWLLGDVRSQETATFVLPRGVSLPSELQILGVSVALRSPRATAFAMILPGDRLAVTLRSPERLSTLLKRR